MGNIFSTNTKADLESNSTTTIKNIKQRINRKYSLTQIGAYSINLNNSLNKLDTVNKNKPLEKKIETEKECKTPKNKIYENCFDNKIFRTIFQSPLKRRNRKSIDFIKKNKEETFNNKTFINYKKSFSMKENKFSKNFL